MTKLFEQIEQLIPTMHGWCPVDKAHRLAACVLALQPEVVVEIGVWGGRSLVPMALAMKELGKGMVYGIDPWAPQASIEGQGEADRKWWSESGEDPQGLKAGHHESVYNDFLQHLKTLGVENVVSVIRAKSDDVEPPRVIDLFHLDGNHGPQAEIDAKRFAPKVRVGGLCCLDDLNWSGGGVARGEEFIKSIGFVKLYDLGTGALYQRIGVL